MSQEIPWKRFVVEAIVIISSILLAFAIDAAWETRQTRASERAALEGLRQDFVVMQEQLGLAIATHRVRGESFEWFQAATREEILSLSPESSGDIYRNLYVAVTFDVTRGGVDALIGSGTLNLIQNRQLRDLVSTFLTVHDDLADERAMMSSSSYDFQESTIAHGGPWQGGPRTPMPLSVIEVSQLASLRADAQVMGKARLAQYWSSLYLRYLGELSTVIDEIVELSSSELGIVSDQSTG